MKEINDKLDFVNIKNICSVKGSIKRIRRQSTDWEKFCKRHNWQKVDYYLKYTKNSYKSTIGQETTRLKQWAKDFNRQLTKDVRIRKKHVKKIHIICHQEIHIKMTWDTTADLLEWPRPRALTTPNAGEDVEQQELSHVAGGNLKWHGHFGRRLALSY